MLNQMHLFESPSSLGMLCDPKLGSLLIDFSSASPTISVMVVILWRADLCRGERQRRRPTGVILGANLSCVGATTQFRVRFLQNGALRAMTNKVNR